MEILQLLCSRRCPLVNTAQLNRELNYSAISSRPPLQNSPHCQSRSQSEGHIATDGQSVSLVVEPHVGITTRYLLLFDSNGRVLWGALSDERTGLSFVYAVGPRQRSLSRVRVFSGS
jgi:hypothetical protein